ncbi:hypothetical protein [Vibrio cyclitrophicus]|uniref:hypothetical protein n=1 Tax=Vibrio cyclitrophicus TaxID=47951 RepID=UPI00029A02C4|nr:hypothetical protein [Vibrio cyclitrophicus]OEE29113.1 hypothetical protein OAM_07555 [Vibrio cyclitrophicus ZF14]
MNTFEKLTEARNLIDQVINRNVGSIGHVDLPAEALAIKQKLLSGLNTDREVFDIVNAINALAMANTDVLHVFPRFSGHVNEFYVRASTVDSEYIDSRANCILNESVYLDQEDALEQLLAIESQLTELIIEAREQAEANAEVTA